MRIQDLTAADFPTIDARKFEEWKELNSRMQKMPLIALGIMVGVWIISVPLIGGAIGWALPVIAYFSYVIPQFPKGRRLRQLTSELGMRELLRAKREELKSRPAS